MQLFQRIAQISRRFKIERCAFGERIGINGRTFAGYFSAKRQDNFWPLLPKILEVFPEISREWLYFGEGTMTRERMVESRSFRNRDGRLIGDLLHDIIGAEIQLSFADFARSIGISADSFQEILDSRRAPTWEELTAMYQVHGINIHFLLTGKGRDTTARTSLARAMRAVRFLGNSIPEYGSVLPEHLQKIFDVSEQEAKDFLAKMATYRERYHKHILQSGGDLKDAPVPPLLPSQWALTLQRKYSVNMDWVQFGFGHSHDQVDYARRERDGSGFTPDKSGSPGGIDIASGQ